MRMSQIYYFLTLTFVLAVLDILVLVRLYALLRRMPNRRPLRGLLVMWSVVAVGFCVAWLFFNRSLGGTRDPFPRTIVAGLYIWHFLFLPVLALGLLVEKPLRWLGGAWLRNEPATPAPSTPTAGLSRRQFLATNLVEYRCGTESI